MNAQVEYYTAQAFPDVINVANAFLADQIIREKSAVVATKSVPLKKTTITCVKGKLTKKVTGIKPTCPKGYKKK
ncbi:unannotated protein [freshwater metagenome]|uniref:Unannotated protein n=1 Tax=freshwater metagenome TaxID=449393 RepID=A0A6J6GBW1_9ZZZZ